MLIMKKKVVGVIITLNVLCIIYIMFVHNAVPLSRRLSLSEAIQQSVNFIPFKSMSEYICSAVSNRINLRYVLNFFVGNFVMLIPIGAAIAFNTRKRSIVKSLPWGISISFIIEIMQLLFGIGSFDIDSIILRTAGIVLGGILGNSIYSLVNMHTKNPGDDVLCQKRT